ncbi:PAS domain-containing protein [Streptomyces anandii]|uniref:PAS domain-containing protein n=1 Tax=Streptomyces anandii TaxID=285454 RepID=UPI00367E5A6F
MLDKPDTMVRYPAAEGFGRAVITVESDLPYAVLRDLGAGVLVLDIAGLITYVNPWALRLLGRTEAGMLGRDAHDLLHRGPDGRPVPRAECTMRAPLHDSRDPGEGSEEYFLRADGTLVPIIWSTTPLVLDGRPAGERPVTGRMRPSAPPVLARTGPRRGRWSAGGAGSAGPGSAGRSPSVPFSLRR